MQQTNDSDVSARADTAHVFGELTDVVAVNLVDAHGHPRDLVLDLAAAADLSEQLSRAARS